MKKKILVTDDDPFLRDIFRFILEQAGYEVEVLADGTPILENHYDIPDLYLLDKQLPGIDGLEICKHLKSQKNTQNIPVIMISANIGVGIQAKEAGADAFIEKPFEKGHLLEVVEGYIH